MAYIDAYNERMEDEVDAAYQNTVEATRAAMIFARKEGDKQYQSWRRKVRRGKPDEPRGLTGQALETAIMGFAAMHPEYVVVGGKR